LVVGELDESDLGVLLPLGRIIGDLYCQVDILHRIAGLLPGSQEVGMTHTGLFKRWKPQKHNTGMVSFIDANRIPQMPSTGSGG